MGATDARWRPGTRLRRLAAQAVFLAGVAALLTWFGDNLTANLRRLGFATGFAFLQQPAGFPIAGSDFPASGTVLEAIRVGVRNTVGISAVGIVLATVAGFVVGVFRLSPNRLLRRVGSLYVETIRNIPVLVIIVFMFVAVALRLPPIEEAGTPLGIAVLSNRGIWLPEPRSGWMVLFACLALSVV
ncbi:MAG: ABC transporter permease subunit, partial [Actinomycetota bacterium]